MPRRPLDQPIGHRLQRHVFGIADFTTGWGVASRGLIDQRTGEQNRTRSFEQGAAFDGDQVRIARACPDKPDLAK